MLTKKILPTRQANSVTVQCKIHIKLAELEADLNSGERKLSLADCNDRTIRETLLMNFEIVDLVRLADELLEFEIVDIGQDIHGKKMIK